MPLTGKVSAITVLFEELGDGRRRLRQTILVTRYNNHRERRTNRDAPCHKRRTTSRAARLTIPAREYRTFLSNLIDIRCGMAEVRASTIGPEIVPAGVVGHQHDDIRLLL